jgi:hypothetical protein
MSIKAFIPAAVLVGLMGRLPERSIAEEPKPSAEAVGDTEVRSWVDERIDQFQPTEADRRFDEIGWAKDILDARQLAQQHGRPVFLFTHDGRMAIGRC